MRDGRGRCVSCSGFSDGFILLLSWATGYVATPRPLSQGKAFERRVSLRVFSGTRIGHGESQEPAVVDESPEAQEQAAKKSRFSQLKEAAKKEFGT